MAILKYNKNLEDTKIWKRLVKSSSAEDGFLSKTKQFVDLCIPLLDLINSGPFKEYTLHNRDHAKKLAIISDNIISKETLNSLSALECSILIMSFHLHDLGLVLTSTERERTLNSSEFVSFYKQKTDFKRKIESFRDKITQEDDEGKKMVLESNLFQHMEALLTEYLRPLHATRDRYQY